MPSSLSSPSIFDKLSQKGTVASKQRDAEERETRLKNEQRRQMKTAALTPTKNDRKLKAMQRSPVPQDRIKKKLVSSPKQKDELFDRLAKQETFSSAAHHNDKTSLDNNSVGGCHPLTNSPIRTDRELTATFNRLYKQDTACSRAHQYHKPVDKSLSPKKKITPPPSLLQRRLDYEASGPLIPLKMDVYIRTTEEKKRGTSYNTLDLAQNDLRKQINLYATSKISARALAYDIINALFHRGFTPGRHWKISPATLEELDTRLDDILMKNAEEDGDNIQVFVGMKEAVLDYKDLYSVAKLSAKIMISSAGVYVDEYSYFNLNNDANEAKGKDLELKKDAYDAKKQEEADFRRIKDERAAVKRAEEAAAAKAEAKRRAIEEAEEEKKAQEEEAAAAAKKAQEAAAAESEARRRAIEETAAARKAEEERAAAAAKKAQEEAAAAAEAEARRRAIEEAEAARKAEEEEAAAAAKKAREAAEAEARRRAIEAAEVARKAEEEEAAAAAKKAQEVAAAAVATENKQVEEDVEAAKKYEDEATVAAD